MLYVPLLLKIKSSKTAADTFRSNPDFKVDEAITELGVGEALISCLDEQGTPQIVERGWVMPPYSSFTPITPEERQTLISQSIIAGVYEQAVDRDSAYEMLQNKVAEREQQKQDAELAKQQAKEQETLAKQQAKEQERLAREQQKKRNVRRVKGLNLLKILSELLQKCCSQLRW